MFPTRPIRRKFLRDAGVVVSLPVLHSLLPRTAWAQPLPANPRRLMAMCVPLGIHTPLLFPKTAGKEYEVTPYLQPLQPVREHVSVISGLMHPQVDGGHHAEKSFLTAAPHPSQPGFKNTISLDQYAAEQIGHLTRFPFLALGGNPGSLSFSRSGVAIPANYRPSKVFEELFLEGSAEQKAARRRKLRDGQSILDGVGDQLGRIQRSAGREDQQTLEQYTSSVRELEQRLVQAEEWSQRPKPTVDREWPQDVDDRANLTGRLKLLLDLAVLALQTDSTRLITLMGPVSETVDLKGVQEGWHNLSHHGRSEEKLAQLAIIEREELRLFGEFLSQLAGITQNGRSLLSETAVLFGSNLGNASSHSTQNLPIIVAGGAFRHGQHLQFDPDKSPPLANLFVSFLQHLGLEAESFASGNGTLSGLDFV